MKNKVVATLLLIIVVTTSSSFASASINEDTSKKMTNSTEQVVELGENAVNIKDNVVELKNEENNFITDMDKFSIFVPRLANEGIKINTCTDENVLIKLPKQVQNAKATLTKTGRVLYESESEGFDVMISATKESKEEDATEYGMRIAIVVKDITAPDEYKFTYKLDNGCHLKKAKDIEGLADDEIAIVDNEGFIICNIKEPWAIDAEGKNVSTHYEILENAIVQYIDFDEKNSFPIVADPWIGTSSKTEDVGSPTEEEFTDFAAGQGTKGFKFTNGGYISYSRGSGVRVSISVGLGAGYGIASVSTSIGFATSGNVVSASYKVPKTPGWYKLKATETHKVQKYKVLMRWEDPNTRRVSWKEYARRAKLAGYVGVYCQVVKVASV